MLEIAAGTGAVTRVMAGALPAAVAITATDLVPGMIDRAALVGTSRPVTWQRADAMSLPFEAETFDVVVCQFGAMFFDPKASAFAEMARVLRPGGRLLLSVWNALADTDFAAVAAAVQDEFPEDPPGFLERVPYHYDEPDVITADLRAGGFDDQPSFETIEHVSRAAAPWHVATAFCAGTPLRDEIVARGPGLLPGAIAGIGAALAARYGVTDLEGRVSARFVTLIK